MNAPRFFAELKRRNVYKVAVAYAVVGWLLMQVATQVFPFLEIPNWVVRLVIALVAIGFPIALIIAWAFEVTPQGIKRTEDVRPSVEDASKGRTWIYVAIVGAALSVGLFFIGRYTAQAPRQSESATGIPQKSIAVLPFENLSEDKANAYFAEGIQDEILTRLAKITDLKVIGRVSTQRFKSGTDDLAQIAKQIGVAHLLEGSVQKAGDRVRINVQLINATTSAHLWADTFDRSVTDVFAVETEVAKTIAEKLAAKLTGAEEHAIAVRPTQNAQAHELYLKGRHFWNKRTGADLKRAADYFTQASVADPNYALAYAGLADAYVLMPNLGAGMMPNLGAGMPTDCYPKAKAAALRALQIDENLGEAHTSLACVLVYHDLDFAQADTEYRRALGLSPNYATAHQWFADTVLTPTGRFEEAFAEFKRALELDPLSLVVYTDFATTCRHAGRMQEGADLLQRALEIDPNFYYAHRNLGQILVGEGDYQHAIEEYQKARAVSEEPRMLALLAHAYGLSGNRAEASKLLEQLKMLSQQRYVAAFSFALVYIGLGDKAKALESLEQSFTDRAGADIAKIRFEPILQPLRGEPRFEALTKRVLAKAPKQP